MSISTYAFIYIYIYIYIVGVYYTRKARIDAFNMTYGGENKSPILKQAFRRPTLTTNTVKEKSKSRLPKAPTLNEYTSMTNLRILYHII